MAEEAEKVPHKVVHKLYGTVLGRFCSKTEAEDWLKAYKMSDKYKDTYLLILVDKKD